MIWAHFGYNTFLLWIAAGGILGVLALIWIVVELIRAPKL